MTPKEMREALERALGPFFKISEVTFRPPIPPIYLDIDALAEQAIVIECEVEHDFESDLRYVGGRKITKLHPRQFDDHHGTPGKAIAIILSLEEE